MGTKQPINSAYPVQAPNLDDPANIIDAIKLYHIGEGGTVETPTEDSITSHLASKADTSAPTFTGTATFNDNVVLGSSNADTVTVNANISANSVVITPAKLAYLASASGITGNPGNLVFSASPTIAGATLTGTTNVASLYINNSGSLVFEGSTDDSSETTIAIVDPTADRTVTIPDETGTVVLKDGTNIISNADLTGAILASNGSVVLNNGTGTNATFTGTASNATAAVHYKAASGGDYSSTTPTNKIFTGQTQPTSGMVVGDIWMW